MNRAATILAALALLASLACSRPNRDSEEALKQALERYLASRPNLNMQSMDMDLSGIKFRQQNAEVDVTFRSKGDAKAVMSMHYTLRRQGNGWEVEPQSAAHGGMIPAPSTAELPPGHPTVKKP